MYPLGRDGSRCLVYSWDSTIQPYFVFGTNWDASRLRTSSVERILAKWFSFFGRHGWFHVYSPTLFYFVFLRRFAPARCASFTSPWRQKWRRNCALCLYCAVLPEFKLLEFKQNLRVCIGSKTKSTILSGNRTAHLATCRHLYPWIKGMRTAVQKVTKFVLHSPSQVRTKRNPDHASLRAWILPTGP